MAIESMAKPSPESALAWDPPHGPVVEGNQLQALLHPCHLNGSERFMPKKGGELDVFSDLKIYLWIQSWIPSGND